MNMSCATPATSPKVSRDARRLVESGQITAGPIRIDEQCADKYSKGSRARLNQNVCEIGPLERTRCGGNDCPRERLISSRDARNQAAAFMKPRP